MLQRVITEIYQLQELSAPGFEPGQHTTLMQALQAGWTITQVATAAVGQTHYSTFVLEKWENGESVEGVEQRH